MLPLILFRSLIQLVLSNIDSILISLENTLNLYVFIVYIFNEIKQYL